MKTKIFKIQKKCTFIFLTFTFLSVNSLISISQVKNELGILYPEGYKISKQENLFVLDRQIHDTIRYGILKKIKQDFIVNSGCGEYGSDQLHINIARDDNGNYMCVWVDERSGLCEINAQLFNHNGEKINGLTRVDENYNLWNSAPHIVYNHVSSEYVITWAESGYDIRLQRISKSGEKVGQNISINQQYCTNTNNPSSAVDQFGNILITWISDQGYFGPDGAYYRIYTKDVTPITNQEYLFTEPFNSISSIGWDTRVASDTISNFVVVWSAHLNNRSQIIIQVIKNNGELLNEPLVVSDSTDLSTHNFPTIASTHDGHFLIIWNSNSDIKGRIYQIDSGFVTPQFTISQEKCSWFTYSVSSDYNSNFFVAWTGNKPFSQVITKHGSFIGTNKVLSISTSLSWHSLKLSQGLLGTIYLGYYGYRKNDIDVMVQKFDLEFNSIGNSVKVAEDSCSSWQKNPVVKYNQYGKSIVVWEDKRNGTPNLFGQILDEESNPISENIMINDSSEIYWASNPNIISDNDGNFVICFTGGDYSSQNLKIQKVSSNGTKIGKNKQITDYYYTNPKGVIQKNVKGDLLLCWFDGYSYYSSCYLKKFNSNLIPSYNQIKFFGGYPSPPKKILSISSNCNFEILVIWVDYDLQTERTGNKLKGMIFNDHGVAKSDTLIIDSIAVGRTYYRATCCIDKDKNLAVVASDYNSYGYDVKIKVYRRYFKNNESYTSSFSTNNIFSKMQILKFENWKLLTSWDNYDKVNSVFLNDNDSSYIPIRLHNFDPFLFEWGEPNIAYYADIFNNKLQFCYESIANTDRGFDIVSNIQLIEEFDFDSVLVPVIYISPFETVSPAYPNPNSTSVTLIYEIPKPVYIDVAIYNILGEKISTIDYGQKEPGKHIVSFNTRGLSSGIYFIHYKGIESHTQKFLIMK